MDDEFDLLAALGGDDTIEVTLKEKKTKEVIPEVVELKEQDITEEEAGNSEVMNKLREEILEIHEDGTVRPVESLTDKAECLRQITNILGEYDGLESNIPVTHQYWSLINRYRVM